MKKTFCVIGLGTFGYRTAVDLYEGGADVLALDVDEDVVDQISNRVTRAACLDATDEEAMRAVGAFEADTAIVSIRRHFDTTVLVTHALRRENVPQILVQVDSDKEADAIRVLGATGVIFPERDMAERIARNLLMPDLADQIPLGERHGIIDAPCPAEFVGKTLIELNIRKNHRVTVLAIRRKGSKGSGGVLHVDPAPDEPLQKGDVLVILGESKRLTAFKAFGEES